VPWLNVVIQLVSKESMRSKSRIRFGYPLNVALVGVLTLAGAANCIDLNPRTHLISYAASSPIITNQSNFGAPLNVLRAMVKPPVAPQVTFAVHDLRTDKTIVLPIPSLTKSP